MIVLSLKTYKQATGENAVKLCQTINTVQKTSKIPIIPAAQTADIYRIKQSINMEIWSQHVDPIDPDRHFGWISPYTVKQAGASGVVISHLEHKLDFDTIKKTVAKCKAYNLKTLVIVDTIDLAKKVIDLKPDYLAYENADLIGGNVSMVDDDPEGIKTIAKLCPIPMLVGAGVKTGEHIKKALALGSIGAILASGVILSPNPRIALEDIISGFTC